MDKVALLGHPVTGSPWPLALAALSKILDHDLRVKAMDVPPGKLADAVAKLRKDEYAGAVVGMPHKRSAVMLGSASGEAKSVGAANCVKIEKASLKINNTEGQGIYDALSETGCKIGTATCFLFGAGATARATAYALGRGGAKHVRIWARKPDQAESLAKELSTIWIETRFSAGPPDGPAEVWINATPVGLVPGKLPVKATTGAAVVMDLSCAKTSKLLELGAAARARVLDGHGAIVYQAIRSWELWFGAVGGPGRSVLKADVMRLKRWR